MTTNEWAAKYAWPVGTRVQVGAETGTVTKENATTVRVAWDSGRVTKLVPMSMLVRIEGGAR